MIPELLPDPLLEPAVTDEPVEGTPEDQALKQVLAELDKLPSEPVAPPQVSGKATPEQLIIDALPMLMQCVGEMQQTSTVVAELLALCKSNHKEIHALQVRIAHLEAALALRPSKESDPAMDLPSPTEVPLGTVELQVLDDPISVKEDQNVESD